jgi:hypothetical protein
MKQVTEKNVIENLIKFVDQRPGINARDYFSGYYDTSGRLSYNREVREVCKDRADFYALLEVAERLIERDILNERVYNRLKNESGRLLIVNDKLTYHTGQYFPTEYRPAACRLLSSILWNHFAFTLRDSGKEISADSIRKYAKRYFSRRVFNNYFA